MEGYIKPYIKPYIKDYIKPKLAAEQIILHCKSEDPETIAKNIKTDV